MAGAGASAALPSAPAPLALQDAAGAASGSGEDDGNSSDLIAFIGTAPGARWLTDIMLEWPGHMHNLRKATLAEVNSFVISQYKAFVSSDIGKRMLRAPQHHTAAQKDTLTLPVYIIEDLVRQRLRTKITRNWWSIGVFLATRTPFMCAAVHLAKGGVKRVLARHRGGRCRRLVAAAEFLLDELVPTAFYGPLLAYGLLAHKISNELAES